MDQNQLIIIAAIVVAFILIKGFIKNRRKPPTSSFKCARCKTIEQYTPRTIEAWRKGFKKIYCQNCHLAWLRNNPKQTYITNKNGGCLSFIVMGILPIVIYVGDKIFS